MSIIEQTCKVSGKKFNIDEIDQAFYQKMQVPLPTLSPTERQRRRQSFRNQRSLYNDTCDLCQQNIISIYHPNHQQTVYCTKCWWSDNWDPFQYGKDIDINRGFFDQFREMWLSFPKMNVLKFGDQSENSEYTHDVYNLKNCYLIFDGEAGYDCAYGENFANIKDCYDLLHLSNSELCYETIKCDNCYNINFSSYSKNCSDSSFLKNCIGCQNCFGCINLRNKQYHIFNKQYSPEEYHQTIAQYNLGSYSALTKFRQEMLTYFQQFPHKYMNGTQNESTSGNNLDNCQNTFDSFECAQLRDCRYCTNTILDTTDTHDLDIWGGSTTLVYNSAGSGYNCNNLIANYYVGFGASDCLHSIYCFHNVQHLFGCLGLRQKQYCIFNKQYNENDYHELKNRLIEKMRTEDEFAQFFPSSMAIHGYNETLAHEYTPLTEMEAKYFGYKWAQPLAQNYQPSTFQLPDHINQTPDSITNEILSCQDCQKNYKILPTELKIYKQKNLPIPRKCSVCRHLDRRKQINPRQLWNRNCTQCQKSIQTSYAPDRPETIYCEECYLEAIN